MEIFYVVLVALAAVGIYHIIEEIVWEIEKSVNAEDIEDMIDFMENRKKTEKLRN